MKSVQISLRALILVCFVSAATLLQAASPNTLTNQAVRKEVTKMIQNPELSKNGITSGDVIVNFKINEDNKVELINVASQHSYLKNFVKEKLQNKEVAVENPSTSQEYNIKISFETEQ